MKKLLILMLAAALLLTACGQTMPSGTAAQPSRDQRDIMGDAMREVMELVYDSITVTHGGDYVIEWEDPGMEAHIRFLLDKPEGNILHSDVWDVQFLGIFAKSVNGYDIMLTQPPEGWTQFDMSEILLVENKEGIWHEYEERQFPDIVTLQDLRHFDSLQIFQTSDVSLTDLSGVEQCPHLVRLILPRCAPASLEPLSKMTWLRNLSLADSGTLDLTPPGRVAGAAGSDFEPLHACIAGTSCRTAVPADPGSGRSSLPQSGAADSLHRGVSGTGSLCGRTGNIRCRKLRILYPNSESYLP